MSFESIHHEMQRILWLLHIKLEENKSVFKQCSVITWDETQHEPEQIAMISFANKSKVQSSFLFLKTLFKWD